MEELSKIIADISSTNINLIESSMEAINEEIDKAIKLIDKWIGISKDNAVDVSECIGEDLEILKNLPAATLKDLNTCLHSNLELAHGLVEDSITHIKEFFNDLNELKDEFLNCGLNFVSLSKILLSSSKLLVTVPGRISAVIINSSLTLVNIGKDVSTYIADIVAQVTFTYISISTETIKCIQNKVGIAEFQKMIQRSL